MILFYRFEGHPPSINAFSIMINVSSPNALKIPAWSRATFRSNIDISGTFFGHEHCRVSKVSLFCWHFHFDANSIIGSWNHMKAAQLRKAKSYYSFILPNYAENRNMLKWININ